MPERRMNLPFPFQGISDTVAFGEQEPGTTRDSLNMRGINPGNGRVTGAQRSGLSRFNTNQVSAGNKIQDLNSVIVDNRAVTYAIDPTVNTVWTADAPSLTPSEGIKSDRQSNVYALDGRAGVVKYNSEGEQLFRFALPVADTAHRIRAFHVDEFDCVYAGVSLGGDSRTARMWKMIPNDEDGLEILWQIEPGGFIQQIDVLGAKLYTAQNLPDFGQGRLRIYENIDSEDPILFLDQVIPSEVSDLSVNAAGESFTSHLIDVRGLELGGGKIRPGPPFNHELARPTAVDWTPTSLDNASLRIWAWYDASEVTAADTAENKLIGGEECLILRDKSGNGRHLYKNTEDVAPLVQKGPVVNLKGVGGRQTLLFNQGESLMSGLGGGLHVNQHHQMKSMLPFTSGSQFCAFYVFRPSQQTGGGTELRCFMYQEDQDGAGSDHVIAVDRACGAAIPGVLALNTISYFALTDAADAGACAGADQSANGTAGTSTFTALLTTLWDGGVDPNDSSSGTTRCLIRYSGGSSLDRFEGMDQGTTLRTRIGIDPTGSPLSQYVGELCEIIVLDRRDYQTTTEPKVLTHDGNESTSTAQTINEMSQIEAYLAYKWGISIEIPAQAAANAHPYGESAPTSTDAFGPPSDTTGAALSAAHGYSMEYFPCICKWDPNGRLVWTYSANSGAETEANSGGVGTAVKVDRLTGNVYSIGVTDADSTVASVIDFDGSTGLRMLIDEGDSVSDLVADGAWRVALTRWDNVPLLSHRIDVDKFGNVYASGGQFVAIYDNAGALVSTYADASMQALATAVDKNIPDFGSQTGIDVAEFMFVAAAGSSHLSPDGDTSFSNSIRKVRIVTETAQTGAPRTVTNTVVSNGTIQTFVSGATALSTPTGGSSALSSTSQYIQSAVLYQKIYFVDGLSAMVFDPVADTVTAWESTTAGKLPPRPRLVESWRGRMVLARDPDDPQNWYMSKKDDPLNWEYFPAVPTETDAVAGNNSPAGLVPDLVNTIVPYSDDLLLFGGDHSIWALVGDPAAGGRLDLVSDITGMSWGRPWAKDPNGVLYFFGSRGGLYRFIPGGRPERVSLNKIERRLQDVDLSLFYIRLVYNYRDEGINIFQCPFGAGGTSVKHWFYEIKTDSFWEDQFGPTSNTTTQPTAVHLIDSDAFDDRTLLVGGEDSYIRQWDSASKNDDLLAIDAQTLLGPLPGRVEGHDTQYSGLNVVLTSTLHGGRYEMFAVEDPEAVGSVLRGGVLVPGRNPPKWDRVTGPYCWVRLRNSALDENFAIERVFVHASPAGVARPQNAS